MNKLNQSISHSFGSFKPALRPYPECNVIMFMVSHCTVDDYKYDLSCTLKFRICYNIIKFLPKQTYPIFNKVMEVLMATA